MTQLLVVGSANADLVVTAERRPTAGETVLGGDTKIGPGGKGANTAVAAGRLDADVALLAALGDDPYATMLIESVRDAGVDTGWIRRTDRPTGIAYITVTPDGENSILVSPGANTAVTPAEVDAALGASRVMVVSMEIPIPTVEHAIQAAAAAGVYAVLNLSPAAEVSERTLSALDVLLVNEHEAAWLLDGDVRADALRELGPAATVVTSGARGALVITEDEEIEVAASAVRAVDTTGAGDAFAGALAASLAGGAALPAAVRRAGQVAAVSVTRHGAQPSYPTSDELVD